MFRTQDLPLVAEFFIMFHQDKPIDWLLDHILWVKVCNPEKDHVSGPTTGETGWSPGLHRGPLTMMMPQFESQALLTDPTDLTHS